MTLGNAFSIQVKLVYDDDYRTVEVNRYSLSIRHLKEKIFRKKNIPVNDMYVSHVHDSETLQLMKGDFSIINGAKYIIIVNPNSIHWNARLIEETQNDN